MQLAVICCFRLTSSRSGHCPQRRWAEAGIPDSCNVGALIPGHDVPVMPLRALIVDDNELFLASARRLLEREGIVIVDTVSTGAEALRASEEQHLDVILVDVDLGEESGFDVTERLYSESGDHRPVILISAYPEQDLEDLVSASPAIGFVSKAQLSAEAIANVLGRSNCGERKPSG